jgi:hypothetical protein
MRPRTSLAVAGLAAALTFTLAGCFAPSPSAPTTEESAPTTAEPAPPAISVDPATGDLITGSGYSFNAPEDWVVPPDAPPQADVYVIDATDTTGFVDTVNVLLGPAPDQTSDEIEETAVAYLEGVIGATEVEVRPRVTIGGTESVHVSAKLSKSGTTYWTEQYLPIDAGTAYTTTFAFGEAVAQGDREALAESVLVTWTWA